MGIIFNEDPNHFIYTRTRGGVKSLSEKDLTDFIDQYKDTNITDFLVCLNASMPFYPSVKTQSALDKYREWKRDGKLAGREGDDVINCVGLLCDTYDKGLSMHKIWLDRIRADGMRAWISIRMNDIHNANEKDAFLPSDFTKSHPEFSRAAHRTPSSYYDFALDYMHREVREYYLTVISEALDTFDCDGIELDFMREIYSVGIGREQDGIAVLTEFMSDAVALIRGAEQKRGHKILIGTRMPDSPEKALRLGFDVLEWVRRGYLDLITVTPRWSSSDGDMPIDLWRRVLDGKNVRLAAGLEILCDAYNRRGRKYRNNTPETATGLACAYSGMGADDIYLFNYMDTPWISDSEREQIFLPENYNRFLCTAGNPEKEIASGRRNVVTFCDVYAAGCTSRRPLPVQLTRGAGEVDFTQIRIPAGEIPAGREVRLTVGVERGRGTVGESIKIYVNGLECKCLGACAGKYPAYDDVDYFSYEIPNDGHLSTVLSVELGAVSGEAKIHWLEADIT